MNCLRLLRLTEKQTANTFRITTVKYISGQHLRFNETQDRWRLRDDLPKEWKLIYKAPMDNVLKYMNTYLTFTSMSVALSGLYYGLFVHDPARWNQPILLNEDVVIASNTTECLIYIGAFIASHIALKVLLSKYVTRLYQNGDDYMAIYYGNLYNSTRKHGFQLKDVEKLKPTLIIPWGNARFSLGKKHAILLETYFKTPEYFNNLMKDTENTED